ncbi:MAG TPA: 30S ribosome-binding factor RbfA [Candidatus Acidoferrales bacterium]|jgi:ribosome-binding factor A|nr:30S ribosome-binding factor RbfA [Candidatus Acidoferrales bacterium]
MTVVGHRHERIAEEIHHEVDIMLAGELRDPRLDIGMTVTEVRVGPDLKQARVYVDIEGTPEEQTEALAGLEAAGGYIRHELCERLQIRRSPELRFFLDTSIREARRIEELLRQVKPSSKPGGNS